MEDQPLLPIKRTLLVINNRPKTYWWCDNPQFLPVKNLLRLSSGLPHCRWTKKYKKPTHQLESFWYFPSHPSLRDAIGTGSGEKPQESRSPPLKSVAGSTSKEMLSTVHQASQRLWL